MALAKYPEGFDANMAYELRDKEYNTLEDMQKGAITIEANLMEKRARLKAEKRVTYRDDNVASTSDPKYDRLSKNVEELQQMIKRMVVQNNNQNRNQNQNIRRNNAAPNRQRESNQKIIPPFQEKILDEDEGIIEESEGNTINMFEAEDSVLNYDSEDDQPSPSYWDEEWLETEDYRLGFEDSMLQVREQYELRRKKIQDTSKAKTPEVTIKKRPNKSSKASATDNKTTAESSGKHKEKDNQNNEK